MIDINGISDNQRHLILSLQYAHDTMGEKVGEIGERFTPSYFDDVAKIFKLTPFTL